jgi:hypothetical protein
MKIDESSILAEMDKNLTDNKELFSTSAAIEKLAFKRVSDAEEKTEIEQLFEDTVLEPIKVVAKAPIKTAADPNYKPASPVAAKADCKVCKGFFIRDAGGPQCACTCKTPMECKSNPGCTCHTHPAKPATADFSKLKSASIISALVKISNELDNNGFDKLAAVTLLLADKIVAEAKAKNKPKSKSKSKSKSKPVSKEKSKSKGSVSDKDKSKSKPKMDVKERMKKMREMQGKKKKSEKK